LLADGQLLGQAVDDGAPPRPGHSEQDQDQADVDQLALPDLLLIRTRHVLSLGKPDTARAATEGGPDSQPSGFVTVSTPPHASGSGSTPALPRGAGSRPGARNPCPSEPARC